MKKISNNGMTLIELLVVIAIIGILSLIAYTGLTGARTEARKATIKASMDALRPAAEIWFIGNNYTYEGFCVDVGGAVAEIEAACDSVYSDCDCSTADTNCSDGANSWSVKCETTIGSFDWTCDQTSCY